MEVFVTRLENVVVMEKVNIPGSSVEEALKVAMGMPNVHHAMTIGDGGRAVSKESTLWTSLKGVFLPKVEEDEEEY